ncbi:MAG: hypothetical protein ACRC8N_10425, partial [Aeromonas veronii]
GEHAVIYNPGSSVPLQVIEGDTATRITKRISIIRCSDPMMWYSDPAKYKGLLFDVLSTNEDGYLIRTPDGTTNYVRYWDATLTYHTERVKL